MSSVTANKLKTRGVKVIEEHLQQDQEVLISVRGQNRYVVMTVEKYNYLRELELTAAVAETRADYNAGRYTSETIAAHIRRVGDGV